MEAKLVAFVTKRRWFSTCSSNAIHAIYLEFSSNCFQSTKTPKCGTYVWWLAKWSHKTSEIYISSWGSSDLLVYSVTQEWLGFWKEEKNNSPLQVIYAISHRLLFRGLSFRSWSSRIQLLRYRDFWSKWRRISLPGHMGGDLVLGLNVPRVCSIFFSLASSCVREIRKALFSNDR